MKWVNAPSVPLPPGHYWERHWNGNRSYGRPLMVVVAAGGPVMAIGTDACWGWSEFQNEFNGVQFAGPIKEPKG